MSSTRTVALLLLAAGCSQSNPPGPTAAQPGPAPRPVPAAVPTAPTPKAEPSLSPADVQAATAVVGKLIDGIVAGRPDPALLSPRFRTLLADGDEFKADWAAEQYLRGLASGLSLSPATASPAGPAVIGFRPPAGDSRRGAFRVVRVGSDWRIDWLHVGPPGPVVPLTGPAPDLAQRFAVATFLEPALTGQYRLAEAALSSATRSRIAPPLGNDPLGYSRGILTNALKAFASGATGYTVTVAGTQATGELLGPGGDKRPFKLTLADGLVSDFEPR